jgi:hypothetical protein
VLNFEIIFWTEIAFLDIKCWCMNYVWIYVALFELEWDLNEVHEINKFHVVFFFFFWLFSFELMNNNSSWIDIVTKIALRKTHYLIVRIVTYLQGVLSVLNKLVSFYENNKKTSSFKKYNFIWNLHMPKSLKNKKIKNYICINK